MGFFDCTDYFKLGENLDFVSHDQYPSGFWIGGQKQTSPSFLAATLDFMRGIKDKPFWIMEQQAGPAGWELMGRTPRPGQLRLWTAQSVAHGADAVVCFRWRTCIFGTEQYWHGILPHNGILGRRYDEIKQTIRELGPIMERVNGTKSRADAAMLFSYDQSWALKIQPHHPDLDYVHQTAKYYEYFSGRNIPVDFIRDESDFSGYRLVVVPLHIVTKPEVTEKIKAYVANGGNVVFTMRSSVKNENNVCLDNSPLPCGFNDLLGIEILDYDCLRPGSVRVVGADGSIAGAADKWCDMVSLKGAQAVAFYGEEYYKGVPSCAVNVFGKGKAYYVGFEPDGKCDEFRDGPRNRRAWNYARGNSLGRDRNSGKTIRGLCLLFCDQSRRQEGCLYSKAGMEIRFGNGYS